MVDHNKLDPATAFVRSLDGTYYMVREAADLLGVNHRLLRKFMDGDDADLKPSFLGYLGKVKIYLYTADDIDKIREYLEQRKTVYPNLAEAPHVGRPAKYTKAERKERQRLYSKAHYYGRRAREEHAKGHTGEAAKYLAKQRQTKKELDAWPQSASPSASPTKPSSTATEPGSSSSTQVTFQAAPASNATSRT